MNIQINVNTGNNCDLVILDISEYSIDKNNFIKSVTLQDIDGNVISSILTDKDDTSLLTFKDGYFKISFILIPTKEYIEINNPDTLLVYYSDGLKIYKNNGEIVDINELINVNINITNLYKYEKEFIHICRLKKCYINYCKNISIDKCGKYISNYNRDLLWMTINIISYLSDFGLLEEANNILNNIQGCNGICKQEYREVDSNECGCS